MLLDVINGIGLGSMQVAESRKGELKIQSLEESLNAFNEMMEVMKNTNAPSGDIATLQNRINKLNEKLQDAKEDDGDDDSDEDDED